MRFVFVHGGFHAGWRPEGAIAELDELLVHAATTKPVTPLQPD